MAPTGRRASAVAGAVELNTDLASSLIAAVSTKPHETNKRVDNFKVGIPVGTNFIGEFYESVLLVLLGVCYRGVFI